MTPSDVSILARRRLAQLLLGVVALWLTHRGLAAFAVAEVRPLARGYSDAELLSAGGDLVLELVRTHEQELQAALVSAGVVLAVGRLLVWTVAFFVDRAAFELAWPSALGGASREQRPLHTALSLPLVVVSSLGSVALATCLLLGVVRAGRWLRHQDSSHAGWALGTLAVLSVVAWVLSEVWLELWRLAVSGARRRPIAAARSAARAFRNAWGRLSCTRALLALSTLGVTAGGVLLLPALTQEASEGRVWATVAIELGLLGALCLRAAWLCWASGHLSPAEFSPAEASPAEASPAEASPAEASPAEVSSASSADAAKGAAPDEPLDPSPDPDASRA